MRKELLAIVAACLSGVIGASAHAQPASGTAIDVQLGPAVQGRADELGRSELDGEREALRRDVAQALARRSDRPAAVHLVIADIEPNRPTSAQLGASTQLQQGSFGLGGAAITGEVVTATGERAPLRLRYFPDQLRNETDFTTWADADEAFDRLAAALGKGQVPDDPRTWPPPHRPRAVTGTRIPG